jgi:hypothetical protein
MTNIDINLADATEITNNAPESPAGKTGAASLLSRIMLPASVLAGEETTNRLTEVELRVSPPSDAWVMLHPEWRVPAAGIKLSDDHPAAVASRSSRLYIVDPTLYQTRLDVQRECRPYELRVGQTSGGRIFVWAVSQAPGSAGDSARAAANLAERGWVRVEWAGTRYEAKSPVDMKLVPAWSCTFEEVIDLALRDRLIESSDHPVLRHRRGEI